MALGMCVARCCGPAAFEGDGRGGREDAVGVFIKPLPVLGQPITMAVRYPSPRVDCVFFFLI